MPFPGRRYSVLGPVRAADGDAGVPVPAGRCRVLLAALLAARGRPVPVEDLVDVVWEASPPQRGGAALHTVVSRLRGALGQESVVSGGSGYRIVLDGAALDAADAEAGIDAAADLPPREAAHALEAALALWSGPAYDGLRDRTFLVDECARLDALRLDALDRWAAALIADGRPADCVGPLRSQLARFPDRDRTAELLVRALTAAGRPDEARDAADAHRRAGEEGLWGRPSAGFREASAEAARAAGAARAAAGAARAAGAAGAAGAAAPRTAPRHGPVPLDDGFVGREEELRRLPELVARHRVVCITGTAGVGKARLALEALPEIEAALDAPAAVVTVGDRERGTLAAAVAEAVGLASDASGLEPLLEQLSHQPQVLVLLHCGRRAGEVGRFAGVLADRAPGVRIVATSRVRLGVPGERVVPLPPLGLPARGAPPAEAGRSPAVRLFLDRLLQRRPGLVVTDQAVTATARLVRALDGVPLAIELAAQRAATLGVAPLLDRLGAGLDLRTDGRGPGTLRDVIAWSDRQLGEGARAALAALSVLRGPFDAETAEAVAGPDAADCLAELADASLVEVAGTVDRPTYRLLGPIRAYAAERLTDTGGRAAAERALIEWAATLVRRVAAAEEGRRDGGTPDLRALDADRHQLVLAIRSALAAGDAGAAAAITGPLGLLSHWRPGRELWDLVEAVADHPGLGAGNGAALARASAAFVATERGRHAEGLARAGRVLLDPGADAEACALALLAEGIARHYAADAERARQTWDRLLALPGAPASLRADALSSLAMLRLFAGAADDATELARSAVEAAGGSGSAARAFCLLAYGATTAAADPRFALGLFAQAARDADALGATHVSVMARIATLRTRLRAGGDVLGLAEELLERQGHSGDWPTTWTLLRLAAELLERGGRPGDAELVLAAADRDPAAPVLVNDDIGVYRAVRDRLREALGPSGTARARALSGVLSRPEVVARCRAALRALRPEAEARN